MKTAGKFLGLFVCLLVLLSFLEVLHLPLVYSSNVPQTLPTIQDFWINSTWANQPSQFAFNVTDSLALVNATLQTNCTGSNRNSTVNLSGTSAWANYTVTLPSNSSVVAFQFWVWNTNPSISATTTGLRYINDYNYTSPDNGNPTPQTFNSLIDAIKTIEAANNWTALTDINSTDYDLYVMTILDQSSTSILPAVIDNYTTNKDWHNVLKWSAICNKLWSSNIPSDVETDINYALGNFTMVGSLPFTKNDSSNVPTFSPEDKWALYGYYYANQSWALAYNSSIIAKWNVTAAYQQFNSSVYYAIDYKNAQSDFGCPLWIYVDGTAITFTNRYYDEDACTIECYILFDELLDQSDAMTQALNIWNLVQTWHWNGSYYGYNGDSPTGTAECEAAFFLEIISQLRYYYSSLANWTNVMSDIGAKFVGSEWNSILWSSYVCVHAAYGGLSNPQTRLENTIGAWQALLGTYMKLSSSLQSNMIDMLYGNTNTAQAWKLLLAGESVPPSYEGIYPPLFNVTLNLFRWQGYVYSAPPLDYDATAWGTVLLFLMGIVPGTTTIAFPLEELNYEYIQDIDPQIMNINTTTCFIEIPVATGGTMTFQYGVSPITCYFNQSGVWAVTFTDSWNNIASLTYKGSPASVIPEYPTHILLAIATLQTLTILIVLNRKKKKPCEKT